jgi:hypothetical protein
MPSWQLDEQVRIPAEAAAPVSGDEGPAPPDYEMHFVRGPDGKIASPIRLSIKPRG